VVRVSRSPHSSLEAFVDAAANGPVIGLAGRCTRTRRAQDHVLSLVHSRRDHHHKATRARGLSAREEVLVSEPTSPTPLLRPGSLRRRPPMKRPQKLRHLLDT
jgi:hypothetical protein